MRRPVVIGGIGAVALFCLGGCTGGVLDPKGPIGAAERLILFDALAIMLAIVIPVIVLAGAVAWWFRASNTRAVHLPDWAYSGRLELLVWSIPIMVILFLGGLTWTGSHDLDPWRPIAAPAKAIEIDVVSLDWKWLFIYPAQKVASINELAVPAGVPLNFHLTSATVMNSFFIPQLGSQIYTMAGMTTRLSLLADKPETFTGRSVQFSGDGFSGMHFKVLSLNSADFDGWIAKAAQSGSTLDATTYQALANRHDTMMPATFRDADPHLFEQIVESFMSHARQAEAGTAPPKTFAPGPAALSK